MTRILAIIFFFISFLAFGQTVDSKLLSLDIGKRNRYIEHTTIYLEKTDLTSLKTITPSSFAIILHGLPESYQFVIGINGADTFGFATAFSYEVRHKELHWPKQRIFGTKKYTRKSEWTLTKKVLRIPPLDCARLLNILLSPDLYKGFSKDRMTPFLDGVQVDGTSYEIQINHENKRSSNKILSSNLTEKLVELDRTIQLFLKSNPDLSVKYRSGYYYNSRHSSAWRPG